MLSRRLFYVGLCGANSEFNVAVSVKHEGFSSFNSFYIFFGRVLCSLGNNFTAVWRVALDRRSDEWKNRALVKACGSSDFSSTVGPSGLVGSGQAFLLLGVDLNATCGGGPSPRRKSCPVRITCMGDTVAFVVGAARPGRVRSPSLWIQNSSVCTTNTAAFAFVRGVLKQVNLFCFWTVCRYITLQALDVMPLATLQDAVSSFSERPGVTRPPLWPGLRPCL